MGYFFLLVFVTCIFMFIYSIQKAFYTKDVCSICNRDTGYKGNKRYKCFDGCCCESCAKESMFVTTTLNGHNALANRRIHDINQAITRRHQIGDEAFRKEMIVLLQQERQKLNRNASNSMPPQSSMSQGKYDRYMMSQPDKRYQDLAGRYYHLSEQINATASVLYNLKITHGPQMDELISKCHESIFLTQELIPLWRKYTEVPIAHDGYKRLCMIYEAQENYEEAIPVCTEAIKLGFVNDGTKGQMYGRLARLVRKSGKPASEEVQKYLFKP